jgi:hypothetical protein
MKNKTNKLSAKDVRRNKGGVKSRVRAGEYQVVEKEKLAWSILNQR